ncbi:sentrin-specific protease 2-like [Panicum virgatum]|uniref:sentrin-specific protease 2-like n=1 Tax=Panicum virgatum TaxID=38727 RepID=UPI0019D50887|nr:sentrin-specific protease 2-like [Panicum virgatum]
MIFLPINQNRSHWYLAVINTKKQEIHVLDSLGIQLQEREELKYTLKQIEQCLELASIEFQSSSWPDYKVASWKVTQVEEIPKQTDMSSCGLFMIKYLEHWTGEKLNEQFTQVSLAPLFSLFQ